MFAADPVSALDSRKVRSTISGYPFHSCFSARDATLLEDILQSSSRLSEQAGHELLGAFERWMKSLSHIMEALKACPSVYASESVAGRTRDLDTLIERLCQSNSANIDFVLPTRALLGQAFVQAKINFIKTVLYVLENDATADPELRRCLENALEESIYLKLAEELLTASVSNGANSFDLKKAAARLLIPMWEQRQMVPVEAFTSLLLSIWRARCRVQETFGTLVGVHEVFSLMRAECQPRFLDFFTREWVTEDEREAFREFLFGVSFEELQKIREYMEDNSVQVVGPSDVWNILGYVPSSTSSAVPAESDEILRDLPHGPPPRLLPSGALNRSGRTAEFVYNSYRRRRIRADYRALTKRQGPRKTAEGYLMEYHLLEASREAEAPSSTPGC